MNRAKTLMQPALPQAKQPQLADEIYARFIGDMEKSALEKARKEMGAAIEAEKARAEAAKANAEKELALRESVEAKVSMLNSRISELTNTIDALRTRHAEERASHIAQNDTANSQYVAAKSESEALQKSITDLVNENQRLNRELQQIKSKPAQKPQPTKPAEVPPFDAVPVYNEVGSVIKFKIIPGGR